MSKYFKYYFILVATIIILVPGTIVVASSQANTLAELRSELKSLQNQKAANQASKNQTQSEINSAKNSIADKQTEIVDNQNTIIEAQAESEQLTTEIEEGKEELSSLVSSYQLLSGDNLYLEYVFEATSYEDLIYRYAVMEQIMDYQSDKIDEWTEKIAYNEQLQKDLEAKEIELNSQIDSLNYEVDKLGDKLSELDDMVLDINGDIASIQASISYYEKIGCKETQLLSECLSIYSDTHFRLPLVKGTISSSFGYRRDPITGAAKSFHSGTDIATAEGSNVYAVANGTVAKIWTRTSCGGNVIFIQHFIGGKKYTTAYMHLLKMYVSVGDKVTSETVIGLSGGKTTSTRYGGYDTCTTGAHLHLSLATGWYGTDYNQYSSFRSHLIDPKTNIPLPNSWSKRN